MKTQKDFIKEAKMLLAELKAIEKGQETLREREGVIRNKLQRLYNLGIDKDS